MNRALLFPFSCLRSAKRESRTVVYKYVRKIYLAKGPTTPIKHLHEIAVFFSQFFEQCRERTENFHILSFHQSVAQIETKTTRVMLSEMRDVRKQFVTHYCVLFCF